MTSDNASNTPSADAPESTSTPETPPTAFESAAGEAAPGLLQEFWCFICENKAWWLVPLLLALALIGVVVWLSGTAIAPFIYPLF